MILILIIFLLIALFEWRSLADMRLHKRKLVVVMVFIAFTALLAETLYILQDRFLIADLIEYVFAPLEHAIAGSKP